MNIDFPPSSNGIYNNAGSSRQLANYMEHEDMERITEGVFVEGFFNLSDDNVPKAEVLRQIDNNIGQLLKTDAKFYAIHVSPSERELAMMGKTEKEQSDAMKRYIREVFIPTYARNFNKDLNASDIKFFGKIHFKRDRSENKLNMHCHLVVSRKDQSNKKKLSPLTNHRNTEKGAIKGGFDRKTLFQQAETGFDRLFDYQRELQETFVYCNTMKNGKIEDKMQMQELELKTTKNPLFKEIAPSETPQNQKNSVGTYEHTNVPTFEQPNDQLADHLNEQSNISSLFSILPSAADINSAADDEQYMRKPKRKKRPKRKIS